MKVTIHKVILTYTPRSKRSVYRTDEGLESARRFANEWAAHGHVATVRILQGRSLIEQVKPKLQ